MSGPEGDGSRLMPDNKTSDRRINLAAGGVALIVGVAVALVILLSSGGGHKAPPTASQTRSTATAPNGPAPARPFAASSVWNAPLAANAPIAPNSSGYTAQLLAQIKQVGSWINTTSYSVPVYTIPAGQAKVPVTLDHHGGDATPLAAAFREGVPIPLSAEPAAGTDHHMVVWQPSSDTLWEFWLAAKTAGAWHATWGGRMTNVSANPGYFTSPTDWGGSATSLSLLGGLMRISELRSGVINHALALAIPNAAAGVFASPAQRSDGHDHTPGAIPEGTRFRLNPKLDIASLHLPLLTRMIALAAQRFGIIVRDQSGTVSFYGEDPRPYGANPYTGPQGLFEGKYPSQLLASFPWRDLEVVQAPLHHS